MKSFMKRGFHPKYSDTPVWWVECAGESDYFYDWNHAVKYAVSVAILARHTA